MTNRFDFLRLVFAAIVAVYHLIVLVPSFTNQTLETVLALGAEISIQGFFIISGALVSGSLDRSRDVRDYAGKRVRRLYPAYAVIVCIPALISLFLTGEIAGIGRYLAANLTFLNFFAPTLPGLFEGQSWEEVNGALWTLKIEVLFYVILPVLLWFLARVGRFWPVLLFVLYGLGQAWYHFIPMFVEGAIDAHLPQQLPGQMAFFASGIAIWKSAPFWTKVGWRPLLVGAPLFGLSLWNEIGEFVLRPGALALCVGVLAYAPGWRPNVTRFGDFSYGIYIAHFPIIQTMIAFSLFTSLGTLIGSVTTACLVFAASLMLWHVVEKPSLRPSSHYRQDAREPDY